MATGIDGIAVNCRLCIGLVCCGTRKEFDKSSSWHWVSDIHLGFGAVHWRVVDTRERKEEKENVYTTETYGESVASKVLSNSY